MCIVSTTKASKSVIRIVAGNPEHMLATKLTIIGICCPIAFLLRSEHSGVLTINNTKRECTILVEYKIISSCAIEGLILIYREGSTTCATRKGCFTA